MIESEGLGVKRVDILLFLQIDLLTILLVFSDYTHFYVIFSIYTNFT